MNTQPTSEDDNLDTETFDIGSWLTPEGDKSHRRKEQVAVYKDTGLAEQIQVLRDERADLEQQTAQVQDDDAQADLAVGESGAVDFTDLERREEEMSERINSAKVTITITGMIAPEIAEATKNLKQSDTMQSEYKLLAESAEFPGGIKLTADQWAKFHNTIGEGQMASIVKAWTVATHSKPRVTAPFSQRS